MESINTKSNFNFPLIKEAAHQTVKAAATGILAGAATAALLGISFLTCNSLHPQVPDRYTFEHNLTHPYAANIKHTHTHPGNSFCQDTLGDNIIPSSIFVAIGTTALILAVKSAYVTGKAILNHNKNQDIKTQ